MVTIMLAVALGLSVLGYYQLRRHNAAYRANYHGSYRGPCPQKNLCRRKNPAKALHAEAPPKSARHTSMNERDRMLSERDRMPEPILVGGFFEG